MSLREPKPKPRQSFPWLPLTILLATVVLFWVYPMIRKDEPVRVEFVQDSIKKQP